MVKLNMINSKKIIEMKIDHKFVNAEFIERPNRFLTKVKIKNRYEQLIYRINYGNHIFINMYKPNPLFAKRSPKT